MQRIDIKVPELGEFTDVSVIEVLVEAGERIEKEQSLITLESDKATMEIPSSNAGRLVELRVNEGDRVNSGDVIAVLEVAGEESSAAPTAIASAAPTSPPAPAPAAPSAAGQTDCDLLVLGAGPGGYSAAFRAADLGLKVILVERSATLGGVCLNVGCIPSKALLHTAQVIAEAQAMSAHGVRFGEPQIELDALRHWKDQVVGRLTQGLNALAARRRVTVIHGTGRFVSPQAIEITDNEITHGGAVRTIRFAQAIIAAGSEAAPLPIDNLPVDPRLMDSTQALELPVIPRRLLVIGGGIIGLEMATVYAGLGSRVTIVELTAGLLPGTDPDLVKPLAKRLRQSGEIYLNTGIGRIHAGYDGIRVSFAAAAGGTAPEDQTFDRVLVAIGRRPNGRAIGAAAAGVAVDDRGFIPVDRQLRTNVPHIFAIGDINGPPMLAHKASHEGKIAAEIAAGQNSAFDAAVIPSVAYTDPEIAWVGLTESEAKARGAACKVGRFPWAASGRALGMGRDEGFTKLLFEPQSLRLLGAGIVGPGAGDLIAECALAIEMGATAHDIALTIHPHPTLSETIAFAAEAASGTITDL